VYASPVFQHQNANRGYDCIILLLSHLAFELDPRLEHVFRDETPF